MLGTYRRHFRQALLGCSATDCPAFNTPSPSHEPSDAAAIAFSFIQSRTPCECPHANPAESGGEPVGISLEDLERFYNEGQSTGDFGEMCSMVTDAFGKSLKLASSFLDANGSVDKTSVQQVYVLLIHKSPANVTAAFLAATLEQLTLLKAHDITSDSSKLLSLLIILLQNPLLLDPMSHAELLPTMCEVLSKLPQFHHPILCQELLTPPTSQPGAADATAAENREYMARELERLIGIFQHFITLRLLSRTDDSMTPNRDVAVMNATKCLSMFYQANERYHLIPYTEFYNDAVNEQLDIKEDFPHFKDRKGFTFCDYSFILNPAIKADILKVESMFQMRHELQDAFFRALFQGVNSPYLVLEIRRDFIIRDALYQLECKTPKDLKKQLRVQFVGEEGVDEGGVQKEFFQLVIREMFDPKYGEFLETGILDIIHLSYFSLRIHWTIPNTTRHVRHQRGLAPVLVQFQSDGRRDRD
ncbi:hypothetical protein BC938DRAFT_483803 [Jimgerdemannia flammicorona]|uniref:HECT-type E3 ubiquitin transferase n=1 Tax=Jimgerdemannia flammicorona TaxID=994334 RepID=A0A433R066_9FUNG|nr:hypothetical protein BC938DRAFT_483803 [Jimgerdemannia flammicorona]